MKFIGIDAGGTKTKFASYDEMGNSLKECVLPSCHILQKSEREVVAILKEGLNKVINQNDEVQICIGMAGYGNDPSLRMRIENVCELAFAPYPYILKNDAQIALAGALNGQDGILVIAGTGTIALSTIHGEEHRCGGWGYQLDDAGSAYWIAKRLLECFVRQSDMRDEKTQLYEHVKQACGLQNDYEIIAYINNTLSARRDQIAALAINVYKLAQQEEPNALRIYQEAAEKIVELILCLAKSFKTQVNVSYAGGVFQAKDFILKPIMKQLPSHIKLHEPKFSPEYGAYLLASKIYKENL